jgi:DNA modification methylase
MLEVKEWPIDKLIPYARNPRQNDAVVPQMMAAITEFGFRIPIVAKSDGRVIDGHLRLKAAQMLGLESVPVALADDLSEAQIKAFRLLANRSASWAEWDEELLILEILDLQDDGFNLDLLGFDPEEIEGYLNKGDQEVEGLTDPDDVPEITETPISKYGDVWCLGNHKVMCGDSTQIEDVEKLMDGKKARLVITDPPYGVSYADKNAYLNAIAPANRIQVSIEGDHLTKEETQAMWKVAFSNMAGVMDKGAVVYCFMPQGGDQMMMMMMMEGAGIEPRHELIWVKNNHVLGRSDYCYKHEPILYAWMKGGHKFYGEFSTSLIECNKPQSSKLHPTMKPVELLEKLVNNSSLKGELLFDPFLGSGSTLIAAEKTNRICFGLELSPHYVDVICQRWADFTGNDPVRESDGLTFSYLNSTEILPKR